MSGSTPVRITPRPAADHPGPPEELATPYRQYVYAYPHQKSYRRLTSGPLLTELWAAERLDALSLYVHVPFCEMRCGFCNLFTRTGAPEEVTGRFLDTLERQARVTREALEAQGRQIRFTLAAFGGGTPTYLTATELTRLADICEDVMGADLKAVPWSVETSPATATDDRIAVLAERGATRVSIGVQTFLEEEARAAVRPQKRAEVDAALTRLKAAAFPILNIDLIYGIQGQTERSFRVSIDAALAREPEEIYLYPLYVRPLTGLEGRHAETGDGWDEQRLRLYRSGRDHLLAAGYEQTSMRVFRRRGTAAVDLADDAGISEYNQQAGMVGLGIGARSFTTDLHYTTDYAVAVPEVRRIIDDYIATPTDDFRRAQWAFRMDDGERRRMYLLQTLLESTGTSEAQYRRRFGAPPREHFPSQFAALRERDWIREHPSGTLRLTPEGMAWADAIGPLFFSARVNDAMAAYQDR
ncbi:STM4012 family radical SAM protein [Streptomyces sp. CB01881]|uniref:STM4012 family radical SAM protein n=1 Tax=Streptomyces sp. CB01881 TaxID=2078691 RepID=UPI000CDBB576|nr:STM4012 family radical SAM protein [Streptomyces sp. CB01881]AUY48193.1 coproporphyrinogen III oxidase [Streptomyces sp. CB01881]TYC76678.1 coproporphyrinogen III oxidase family protein [Streptomyces sp. CB01881]